jgi:two-component system sensor histidine kinase DegS
MECQEASVSEEPSALLEEAHAIVAELLARLRGLVEKAQQRSSEITVKLRQAERALDEVKMQHQFAVEHNLPAAATHAAREQELRKTHQALSREARALQSSQKQLDQLLRQIDMSSATLSGSSEGESADPWVQALRSQVILGREQERVRLAREVHDSPAQVIANALMVLEQSRTLLKEQQLDRLTVLLDRLCDATREGLHEVRHFIADLRPGRLEEHGLIGTLQEYIERYRNAYSAQVTFEAAENIPRLSNEAEIVLYRITQEALQNAHKHAAGTPVHVTLAVRQDNLLLTIRDEGPGFNPREVARRAGRENWGLTSMRERAEMVGARYIVTSRTNQGTEVSVTLPLKTA